MIDLQFYRDNKYHQTNQYSFKKKHPCSFCCTSLVFGVSWLFFKRNICSTLLVLEMHLINFLLYILIMIDRYISTFLAILDIQQHYFYLSGTTEINHEIIIPASSSIHHWILIMQRVNQLIYPMERRNEVYNKYLIVDF